MKGGRTTLAAVLVTGLLLAIVVPLAGAAVVVTPGSIQRYRDAHVALAGGEYARARALLDELPPDFLLADYAAYFAAEAVLREGDEAQALARFRAFMERYPDSLLLPQAQLAAHDTVFRLGLWADAEREARRFLARVPAHPEAGRILVRLAEARGGPGSGRRGHRRPPAPLDRGARLGLGRGRAREHGRPRVASRVARGAAHHRGAVPPGAASRGRGRAERVGPAARGAPGPGPGADRAPPGTGPARADARAPRPERRGDRAARRRSEPSR